MNLIVGSGPAGSACAHALLDRSEAVLMVDGGLELEQTQKGLLDNLAGGYEEKSFSELAAFQSNVTVTSKGIPIKLMHGSNFPYREADQHLGLELVGADTSSSLAVGGLSNVWGAAILPYLQHDIANWPISCADLATHYEAVVGITGLSGRVDGLAKKFPLYTATPNQLNSSSQASALLNNLDSIKAKLDHEGIAYGASRLAIRPSKTGGMDCIYCGRCLYGCPYGCIYSSSDDLPGLRSRGLGSFQYKSNTVIESIHESKLGVVASGYDRVSKAPVTFEAERVYLGAGVVPSTKIMLKSMGAYEEPVEILDSEYFLFPVLTLAGDKNASLEKLHTLAQIFLEIQDEEISAHTIHLQLYTFNDIIVKTLHEKFRLLPILRQVLVNNLQHRLLIIQGFLHSADSGRIKVQLKQNKATHLDRFTVEGVPNPVAKKVVDKVIDKLSRSLRGIGLFPIKQALEITVPGRGHHYGGSFPMRAAPGAKESDIAGRVQGFSRTHLIDASVFPSIAATTITLTTMANAHRIGAMRKHEL